MRYLAVILLHESRTPHILLGLSSSQPVGFARHHAARLQQVYALVRVSDGRRTGAHFERLNVQKLIRAAAWKSGRSPLLAAGRRAGSHSRRLHLTAHGRDKGWRSAGEQRRPAGAHSTATGDGSITVRVRLSGPDALSLPPPLQLRHCEMRRHWEGVSEAKAFSATRSGRQLSPDAADDFGVGAEFSLLAPQRGKAGRGAAD